MYWSWYHNKGAVSCKTSLSLSVRANTKDVGVWRTWWILNARASYNTALMEQPGCNVTGLEIHSQNKWVRNKVVATDWLSISPVIKCPNCRTEFASNIAVLDHLNNEDSCWSNEPTYRLPIPPGFRRADNTQAGVTGQYHARSGYLFGWGRNILEKMKDHDADQKRRRKINPLYPFVDQAEWQLAEFIAQRLTQTDINKFLKLDWVSSTVTVFVVQYWQFASLKLDPAHRSRVQTSCLAGSTYCQVARSGNRQHSSFLTTPLNGQ